MKGAIIMKKTITLLLSVLILISCIPAGGIFASAEEAQSDYKYELLEDGSIKLTEYLGSETVVNLPSEIDCKTVTAISYTVFDNNDITEVNIPETISEIDDFTFLRSKKLKAINVDENNKTYSSVDGVLFNKEQTVLYCYPRQKEATEYEIPKGVKTIYILSFYRTVIEKITFSSSVRTVGKRAFDSSMLKEVELNNGLKTIRGSAFSLTHLAKVFIPKSVKKMGGKRIFGDSNHYIRIYGYRNSAAQKCAKRCNYKFTAVDPAAPKKTTVKGAKGKIIVNYKKVKKAEGFQVYIYKSGKCVSAAQCKTKKAKRITVSAKKGTYKVKVRAFRTFDGRTVYGKWKTFKNVKVN